MAESVEPHLGNLLANVFIILFACLPLAQIIYRARQLRIPLKTATDSNPNPASIRDWTAPLVVDYRCTSELRHAPYLTFIV